MRNRLVPLLAAATLAASAAYAGPIDAEYVFGDSLSDNGNLAELYAAAGITSGNFPNPPSYHDSFTNGPTAVVDLAASYGLALTPSLWVTGFRDPAALFGGNAFTPGTNYAVAGATAAAQAVGGPPSINLPQQIGAYSARSGGVADPNALYVVFVGGNDVRNATLQSTGAAAIAAGVTAELTAVATLSHEGAADILVVNVPNVGVIPEFAEQDQAQAGTATTLTQLYDQELASGLASLALPDVSLFDLYGYNTNLLANAASEGFTNTHDPCYTNTPLSAATSPACGPGAQNIGGFVYWDSIHPTEQVHALWASGFENALAETVPEPASLALLGAGLLGFAARRRRAG